MAQNEAESQLRSLVADGLKRLNASHGGRYLAAISRRLNVERSTVSRWSRGDATASPEHCDTLSDAWPEYFNRSELAQLQYESLQSGSEASMLTVGAEVHSTPEAVYLACRKALTEEPVAIENQILRLTGFHIDRYGVDPVGGSPHFDEAALAASLAFRAAVEERAKQGWRIQLVLSASSPERAASVRKIVDEIDGPNVEIFGFPLTLPLVMAPVVFANRDVLIVYDHRRWERPGSAIALRSLAVVAWANHYFAELIADAPYRLRSPAGVENDEFARFQKHIELSSSYRAGGSGASWFTAQV
jgi:transcriptional regulator with XRE-family HTH domain